MSGRPAPQRCAFGHWHANRAEAWACRATDDRTVIRIVGVGSGERRGLINPGDRPDGLGRVGSIPTAPTTELPRLSEAREGRKAILPETARAGVDGSSARAFSGTDRGDET